VELAWDAEGAREPQLRAFAVQERVDAQEVEHVGGDEDEPLDLVSLPGVSKPGVQTLHRPRRLPGWHRMEADHARPVRMGLGDLVVS
jgi:hypothetical protein